MMAILMEVNNIVEVSKKWKFMVILSVFLSLDLPWEKGHQKDFMVYGWSTYPASKLVLPLWGRVGWPAINGVESWGPTSLNFDLFVRWLGNNNSKNILPLLVGSCFMVMIHPHGKNRIRYKHHLEQKDIQVDGYPLHLESRAHPNRNRGVLHHKGYFCCSKGMFVAWLGWLGLPDIYRLPKKQLRIPQKLGQS